MRKFKKLRTNDRTNFQNDFLFVDTEAHRDIQADRSEVQTLRLGVAKYWNRHTNHHDDITFYSANQFWNFLEHHRPQPKKELIIYAHNFDYDFKILDGLNQLIERGWTITRFWFKSPIFLLHAEKDKRKLCFWDTTNYVQTSLSNIGEMLGIKKLNVDFDHTTDEELAVYCARDVEILFKFIQYLANFLVNDDLSRMKPTSASLSFNVFRHKFYKENIFLHAWVKASELERLSYRGGLCDCLRVGEFKGKRIYKLDVNSMYPHIMCTKRLPNMLLLWTTEKHHEQDKLMKLFHDNLADPHKDVIAYCSVSLPEGKEWILKRVKIGGQTKTARIGGSFDGAFTTPELRYILDNGEVHHIHQLAVYSNEEFFKEYVDYFYKKRQESDKVFGQFCKMLMNTVYGKFAQKEVIMDKIGTSENSAIKSYYIHASGGNENLIQIGHDVYKFKETNLPAEFAFTAISSLIAAHSRMYLVDLITIAGADNVYYCDTDSLFVTARGYNRLKKLDMVGTELGKLKLEGSELEATFHRPKFYSFGDDHKCKGLKKKSTIISEDDEELVAEMQSWKRFKGALRDKKTDRQEISMITKVFKKKYDKGIVLDDGTVKPYNLT